MNTALKLNEAQQIAFDRWVKKLDQESLAFEAFEEQAVVTSPFTWVTWETGLATEIYVTAQGQTLCLTIDDDGEFSGRISRDCPCCGREFERSGVCSGRR